MANIPCFSYSIWFVATLHLARCRGIQFVGVLIRWMCVAISSDPILDKGERGESSGEGGILSKDDGNAHMHMNT